MLQKVLDGWRRKRLEASSNDALRQNPKPTIEVGRGIPAASAAPPYTPPRLPHQRRDDRR